ncbi:hypothetical protein L211DRAFT_844122 [Terfezia boudieri ATCC MYA-4762]|uniref:Uncharacterized protein n=1 Tax=Terfezia boudieri ATCC MYA-4762 TaxID=1051890 RepID=A0A3N4L542_9PEZI|nr:hypothetical protein L211DRAFT_844120 [Terfezia boudieri ATCC MYA-4762]RPB18034.1 hypothetical protein L211DRAFT_844122 [Terfezia boudieri ATCC MYA-4762]
MELTLERLVLARLGTYICLTRTSIPYKILQYAVLEHRYAGRGYGKFCHLTVNTIYACSAGKG